MVELRNLELTSHCAGVHSRVAGSCQHPAVPPYGTRPRPAPGDEHRIAPYTSSMSDRLQDEDSDDEPVVAIEITDELDLHTFAPREIPSLVRDYIDECLERGFERVRIIHGKGIGNLRRTVHAALERHPGVDSYELADETAGSWGATIAMLRKP